MQLCVLRLGLLEDGDVGVGVLPQCEEMLIGRFCLGAVALHGVGATELQMRECSDGVVEHISAMVENFLELRGGFAASVYGQIGLPAYIDGIAVANDAEFIRRCNLKGLDGT